MKHLGKKMAQFPSIYDTRQHLNATLHWLPVLNGVQNCTKESHDLQPAARRNEGRKPGTSCCGYDMGFYHMNHLGIHRKTSHFLFKQLERLDGKPPKLPAFFGWFPLQVITPTCDMVPMFHVDSTYTLQKLASVP